MKFSSKMDDNRVKKREKSSPSETKRRRLFLKQERANQKDASEVSEESTHHSEIGLGAEADIETIPAPVSKPTFGAVQKLKNTRPLFIIFDLETTGLIRQGAMPHINTDRCCGDGVWRSILNLCSTKDFYRARS